MNKTGLSGFLSRRIIGTLLNSFKGFRDSFKYEEAFRVEVILTLFLLPTAIWLSTDYLQFILLVGALLLVLMAELLNTGIEAAVDRVGLEFHEMSGRAKDAGSAAVLVSLILVVVVWGSVLWDIYEY